MTFATRSIVSIPFFLLGTLLLLLLMPGSTLASCSVKLHEGDHQCIASCMTAHGHAANTYVCDETVPWLHHVGGSDTWADATPPSGTGPHTYAVYRGTAPQGCSTGSSCPACSSRPASSRLCLIVIDADNDCTITC